ncbi:MAG: IscS subfamily cysteine desulfurase [Candidatus Omnitrophica bacterium CG11_big_fil_rev_8_21_14_0_20_45_26]|uniref:Cysteine desulfurase IscS n=1 Tax=Candidatus Abzuiibacterium crystallinum TaxID=1974748 RepID=A0A2H0LR03_9BACT|nr:MAG: IscS subfamily cysteine desulfurase [Candidatus Omnitrophica bacterium CG11_big_fil_rev_8_21_14_0_20_45_26]PIW64254.1 MAG: IscS subfamily cysteine desulfurase [Candidatus Omnitrophica bacterium CG12_big_fil_rev_8_21_14_0_65_45_16]
MIKLPIYMDHQSTTPLDSRVLSAMKPYLEGMFGNASSRHHRFGVEAREAVETAREQTRKYIGARHAKEVVWTSGATESNNLAIQGVSHLYRKRGNHIITSVIEHKSVLDTCSFLEGEGFRITYLPVTQEGIIRLQDLEQAITDQTILISIMHANNEIGTIQPVAEIGEVAKKRNIFFHCDASQSAGKIPIDVQTMGIDLLSISAHKMYGPKGAGALYVRSENPRVRLQPLIFGGGQEEAWRSGTLNVPGIAGFAKAFEIAVAEMADESERLLRLRTQLFEWFRKYIPEVHCNGSLQYRLPGNLNVSFAYVEGEALLELINQTIAVSSGSACSQTTLEPSYVLKALGVQGDLAHTSIRFGLGRFNTAEEVMFTAHYVAEAVAKLRESSALYKETQKKLTSSTTV